MHYRTAWVEKGVYYLHELLLLQHPQTVTQIHLYDAVRIIRVLKVLALMGESIISKQEEDRFAEQRYQRLFSDYQVRYNTDTKALPVR